MKTKDILLKQARYHRRQARVRAKLSGTASRPRLTVQRSLQHINCQLIDDVTGKTLASASDIALKVKGTKLEKAQAVGTAIAEAAQKQKITTTIFDRSGYLYHGRIKALAEAARAAGLQF